MSFKTILSITVAAIIAVVLGLAQPALAGDFEKGKQIFSSNCAACHMSGKNVVNPTKTLKKEDLAKYGKGSVEAIATQVTNGAGAMPSFRGRLNPDQIQDVATYVFEQSEKGW